MQLRVGALHIIEVGIAKGNRLFDTLPGYKAAGIHSGGQPLPFCAFQHFSHKLRLHQTFSAGEGNTAVTAVEVPVLSDLLHKFFHSVGLPHLLQCSGGAVCHIFQIMNSTAAKTANAFGCEELDLGFRPEALRVMAPAAAQRTALQKHGGTDARPIVNAKPLDIKYRSCHSCPPKKPSRPPL